ncbi:MAG TPA: precorrin-6y C5,15-methyltransferase (decarboxylating) subunit CbiE [Acetobacteraceae bacterium]|nr:precorrin-6y C5,15-methyltransferase (decarboxylating) subunit CbiE [Acetobacteraceae bacterium]
MTRRWLSILGIGEDGVETLSPAARALLSGAALVVGGARHLALADRLITGARLAWPSPLSDAFPAILARRGEAVVVLASGDPYCFGVGASLARIVPPEETLCLPAPSAFSLACARLGWAAQEVAQLSFCGRPLEAVLPRLQPGARLLALSADATTPAALAALLRAHGFGPSRLWLLESLGGPRERVRVCTAEDGPPEGIDPLNLVAMEVVAAPGARIIPLACGLPDALFEHDGQITKREIRAMTLATLAPLQGEMLWDIGCGSGSISIEWMLRHPANRAVALDERTDRASRAARNAASLGVPGLKVITGAAPVALTGLPTPDAVFVGGGATRQGVLETAWAALRPGGRMVVNAVAVETEAVLIGQQRRLGGSLTRIAVEHLEPLGPMRGFRPARTVTQWVGVKA